MKCTTLLGLLRALTPVLALSWASSEAAAQDDEPPPPPAPIEIEDPSLAAAFDQIRQYLEQQGAKGVVNVVVVDDRDEVTEFATASSISAEPPFQVPTALLTVPARLSNGNGAVTTAFEILWYKYRTNPIVSGSCGPNQGGSRTCN